MLLLILCFKCINTKGHLKRQKTLTLKITVLLKLEIYYASGESNGNPLQCSCLENPRDDRAWWAAICGVAQSRTRLKRLSSSSSSMLCIIYLLRPFNHYLDTEISLKLYFIYLAASGLICSM